MINVIPAYTRLLICKEFLCRKFLFDKAVYDCHEPVRDVEGKLCPYYSRWYSMLVRCYCEKYQINKPTYVGCSVSNSWLQFSNFKRWMKLQVLYIEGKLGRKIDLKDYQLDKDILELGNKHYCEEFCILVYRKVNMFVVDSGPKTGGCLRGVSYNKNSYKYEAHCSRTVTYGRQYLGLFDTEQSAHTSWRNYKHKVALKLADSDLVTDDRVAKVLVEMFK